MSSHLEWVDASESCPTLHDPGAELPDGQFGDAGHYTITLTSGSDGVAIEGTLTELGALVEQLSRLLAAVEHEAEPSTLGAVLERLDVEPNEDNGLLELGDGPFLLVERNLGSASDVQPYYFTRHESRAAAVEYSRGGECAEDWEPVEIVELLRVPVGSPERIAVGREEP